MNKSTDTQWYSRLRPDWWRHRAENFEGFLLGLPQDEDLVADGWTATWKRFNNAASNGSSPDRVAQARQVVDYEKMREIRARISAIVQDPITAEALKPYYNWFCKRPLFHDGYFEAFNRKNVTLINTEGRGLDRLTEQAIEFDGRSYDVDCIIFASGFETAVQTDRSGGFDLIGKDGITLAQTWRHQMGSLHGMLVRGFPNVGIVGGIKQAAASFNFTYISTMQSRHLAAMIKRCLADGVESFEISEAAQEGWSAKLRQKAQVDLKFLAECTPGYYNNEGQNLEKALFAATYGGGLFEYVAILDEWRKSGYERDLEFERRPRSTAA
jgi:cyclohexanone monooxygenase